MLTTKGLHVRYIATLMLKVDIAKAFDSVSWPFLLWSHGHQHWQRIQRVGVDDSTVDTLNRVPGRHILHHHGLWQGDPLLSLLFLLCAGGAQRHVCACEEHCHVRAIVLAWRQAPRVGVQCRHGLGGTSSLCTNFNKCSFAPIYCSIPEI